MAPTSVSEEQRASREQMQFACAEIATTLRILAKRLDETRPVTKETSQLAYHARRLAALFDRLELEAKGERAIADVNLRSTGRVMNDVAIQLCEACELVDFLVATTAVNSLGQKLARVGDLVGQAFLLCDLRLA